MAQKSITYTLGLMAIFFYIIVDVFVIKLFNIYILLLLISFLVAFRIKAILLPLSYGLITPILIILVNLLANDEMIKFFSKETLFGFFIIFALSFISSLAGVITAFGLTKNTQA